MCEAVSREEQEDIHAHARGDGERREERVVCGEVIADVGKYHGQDGDAFELGGSFF